MKISLMIPMLIHRVRTAAISAITTVVLLSMWLPRCEAADQGHVPLDLLLRNGRVMDGTGNPWFLADIGIRDGEIAAIGQLDSHSAERTLDLQGKVVAPGFIDLHSHADDGLTSSNERRRAAPNLVSQGITTVVVNPDGFGPASIREQLELMQQRGVGPNVIQLVGHGAIRRAVMGSDHRRAATQEEVAQMLGLLRDALDLGAFGMSAGLEYVPGRWSTTDELKILVDELAKQDHIYSVHERSSGADPMWYLPSRDGDEASTMIDNLAELIEIADATGAKVVATHIKARGQNFWGSSRIMIDMIEQARKRGLRIFADQYPYNTSGSDGSIVLIPDWLAGKVQETAADAELTPADELRRGLDDPEIAADLRRDVAHEIARRGGVDKIVIMEHPDASLVGKSLGEVARGFESDAIEAVFRIQFDGDRKRRGGARLRAYSMDELDIEAFARQNWTATCTDAGVALPDDSKPVHPRYYGSFPRKIHHYAIRQGVMTIEDAIRSSTSLPAQILGLQDRGLVRLAHQADLVVFDPDKIRDKATAEDPHQYSEGIEFVLIGGQFVVDSGQLTWQLPGRVIGRER